MSFAMQVNWIVGPSEPTGRSKDARSLWLEAGGGRHEELSLDASTGGGQRLRHTVAASRWSRQPERRLECDTRVHCTMMKALAHGIRWRRLLEDGV